ncbi:MAG TPA: response regulator [Thermoanaerobaculia bacterium]|jgi:CheY-like chemotaxis protein|nr:response regulator [Thermoanaerobaculia bacterium]
MNEVEILLVEDNPHDLELTMRALRKGNLANNITAARDGAEALDFIFARGKYADRSVHDGPRVIFLDLKLPKVDGIDVLRAVKSDERTKKIPIVIITSSAEERDRVESYQLGANSYVVKPIEFDDFMKTITDLGFYWLAVNKTAP